MATVDELTDADVEGIHEATRIMSAVLDVADMPGLTVAEILPPAPREAMAKLARLIQEDDADRLALEASMN